MADAHPSVTSVLISNHADLYKFATRHPFVQSIRDGSVSTSSFTRWLAQDYLFVRAFARFGASVLLKTPKNGREENLDVILNGLAALAAEIQWFRQEAEKWSVDLHSVAPLRSTEEYIGLLEDLSKENVDYGVALVAFWAIEVVYSESFQACLEPGAHVRRDMASACERWGSQEFKTYVDSLQGLADRALEHARPHLKKKAEDTFVQIVTQEVSFWGMSQDDSE